MTVNFAALRRALARAVWLAIIVALVPLPLSAAGTSVVPKAPQAQQKTQSLRAAMTALVTREARSAPAAPTIARAQQSGVAGTQSPAFFKTRAGMIVAALMVAGTGYALYSTKHDRIHSAGKQ